MIEAPTTLATSGKSYHHFGPSSSTNNYEETLQPVISDLRIKQNTICEYCKIIGYNPDA